MSRILSCLLAVLIFSSFVTRAEVPANFKTENLAAWCIAFRWDAAGRSPAERAKLMSDLEIGRFVYNWRADDHPDFEEEIRQCKAHGIEYFAFWNENEEAFALFEKYGMTPQIWKTCPSPNEETQVERVKAAAQRMLPYAQRADRMGSAFGLYNHRNWGGHPENLVAVCKALHAMGCDNVGIVYNFHHAHDEMDRFAEYLDLMKPYLLCLNLNGMTDKEIVNHKTLENKILPIGEGKYEGAMIKTVLVSGYEGPIGIIDHMPSTDSEMQLRANLKGLEIILSKIGR